MIDKLIEQFNNLDRKKRIFIYVIVLLISGLMAYYINYQIFYKTNIQREKKLIKLEKEYKKFENEVKTASAQIFAIKKTYKEKQKEYASLKEDIKYIKYKVGVSKLKISEKDFYNILNKILKISSKNYLTINYTFYKDTNNSLKLTKYIIDMNGTFRCEDYINFEKFITDITHLNVIKSFEVVDIKKNSDNNLSFGISLYIWSI